MLPSLLYIAGICCAELTAGLMSPNPWGGIILHALLLLGLMVHYAVHSSVWKGAFYLTLSLVPLIRILSLSLPLEAFQPMSWYLVVGVPLFVGAFMAIRILRYGRSDIYLVAGKFPTQLAIAATGVLFGLAGYFAASPEPLVDQFSLEEALVPAMILLLVSGFTVEVIFRGVLQRSALEAFGDRGLLLVAAAYAAIHVSWLDPAAVAVALVMGLFLCWTVKKTGSLWGAVLANGIANITALLIAPSYV
jgi:membrane protease YdiL (CAAX protease family)